jgi:hypothetical protein
MSQGAHVCPMCLETIPSAVDKTGAENASALQKHLEESHMLPKQGKK